MPQITGHTPKSFFGVCLVFLRARWPFTFQDSYYGVTTGQAVAPLVVQMMRPWMNGLTVKLHAM
jgi:hypothetical protein